MALRFREAQRSRTARHSVMLGVSIIIPTYNERDNIAPLAREIHAALGGRKHEILVVDDDSPDGTGQVVRELTKEIPALRLLPKERREGIGAALRHGYDQARCDVLLSMDADHSFAPEDIPRLLRLIEDGCDLVLGSRHMPGGAYEASTPGVLLKRLVSALGNRVVRWVTGLKVRDFSANFRAIRRAVWEEIRAEDNSNSLLLEMILKTAYSGHRIEEVPVRFRDRRHGSSKLNLAVEVPKFLPKLVYFTLKFRLFGSLPLARRGAS